MDFRNPFEAQNNRILLKALAQMRPGWTVLQDAVLAGDEGLPELRIEYVLAHPDAGIAILDIMPTKPTPGIAAQQMRRQLGAASEAFARAGPPPLVHIGLHHSKLFKLQVALDQAFSHEPAAPVRCGETWVAALQDLLRATPLEATPESDLAGAPHAPPAFVIELLEDERRQAPKQNRQVRPLFAFWGAVLCGAAGVVAALSYIAPPPRNPALPLSSPPTVAAEGAPPAKPREARNLADVQLGAPQAAEQGAATAPVGVAPVVSVPGDAPAPPGRARVPAPRAAPPPRQELSAPPSVVGAPGPPEAPASQSAAAALAPDRAEPDSTAESTALGPVPLEPVPTAAAVPNPALGEAAAATAARTRGAAHLEDPQPVAPGAQTAGAAAIAQIAVDAGGQPSVHADRRTTWPRDDHSGADAQPRQEPAGVLAAVAGDAAAGPTRPAHDIAILPPATVDAWTTGRPVQAGAAPAPETAEAAPDQRTPPPAVTGSASPGRSPFEDAPQDHAQSMAWYHRAADQGQAAAQAALGVMYANGQSVLPDRAEALRLLRQAAAAGNGTARTELARVEVEQALEARNLQSSGQSQPLANAAEASTVAPRASAPEAGEPPSHPAPLTAEPTASTKGTPGTVNASASAAAAPVTDPSRLAAAAAGRTTVPETTAPRQDPNLLAALVRRGDAMFAANDVSAARLFYERAATGGSAAGATGVGKTHDPAFLSRITAFGIRSDPSAAATWYRKAVTLGDPEAERLLLRLGAAVAD